MHAMLRTGGLVVSVRCEVPWVEDRLREGADGRLVEVGRLRADLRVVVESERAPFATDGWRPVTRDTSCLDGRVVVRDVATSGFDLRLGWDGPVPVMSFRRRPPARTRAASWVLRVRARLLLRAALLQFPVLWAAAAAGRSPLHAAVLESGPPGPLLVAGASGAGKTTMVERAAAAGGRWADDNLAVSDGRTVWGLVEPVRSAQGEGRSAPHGRHERRLAGRVASLDPAAVVLLGRGPVASVSRVDPERAARALVAGTYAAGELRRYWPLHAALAAGSGVGPAHPAVQETAWSLASRVPCFAVDLVSGATAGLGELLSTVEVRSWM
jgi:hypothetical protein